MFNVVGTVTEIKEVFKYKDGKATEELAGLNVVVNGWQEGITLRANLDVMPMVPKINQRVDITARRDSWKNEKGDWFDRFLYRSHTVLPN